MLPNAKLGVGGASFLEALFTATSAVCNRTHRRRHGNLLDAVRPDRHFVADPDRRIRHHDVRLGDRSGGRAKNVTPIENHRGYRSQECGSRRHQRPGARGRGYLRDRRVRGRGAAQPAIHGWLRRTGRPGTLVGVFHSVSSFNNAGFALFSDNLISYARDQFIALPICLAVILGGLGFPVIVQLRKHFRSPLKWTMNTRIVLAGTARC